MMRRVLPMLAFVLAANLPEIAYGHEVRPGYLELQQTASETWSVLWKVPAQGDMRLSIHPRFPEGCALVSEPIAFQANAAYIERTSIACKGGLAGHAIGVDGLSGTMTDVLVRSVRADGSVQVARLSPSAPAFVFESTPRSLEVARAYTVLGVEHILGGIDHLLFVLGLMLLVRNKWFLASELAKQHRGDAGLMERYPWIVAFIFGLLHGFGFAGALREVGLPESDIPLALFTFNVGVELGQLLFVGTVLVALAVLRRFLTRVPAWMHAMPAYAIGTMASCWLLQRMAALL